MHKDIVDTMAIIKMSSFFKFNVKENNSSYHFFLSIFFLHLSGFFFIFVVKFAHIARTTVNVFISGT